jgi:hypothetical protein
MTVASYSFKRTHRKKKTVNDEKEEEEGEGDGNDKNSIRKYVSKILRKSEANKLNASLLESVEACVCGNAVYIERFNCAENDFRILSMLARDLDYESVRGSDDRREGMIEWSKHLRHDNAEFSETLREIVRRMSEYFDVDVYATRLNFYRDGKDWKPYHHDSHAYANGHKEDFTMGASFGASRELSFLHEESKASFEFPQKNGDVFAFSSEVNSKFKHGIPQLLSSSASRKCDNAPRFSIIAWGKRRSLNSRNSSVVEDNNNNNNNNNNNTISVDETRMPWNNNNNNNKEKDARDNKKEESVVSKEIVLSSNEVSSLVNRFIKSERNKKRKTSKALVKTLAIDEEVLVSIKKLARRFQRGGDDVVSAKEFCEFALSKLTIDELKNLAKYLPSREKREELENALNQYSKLYI